MFSYEDAKPGDSPFVDKFWHTRNEQASDFISTAASQSGIVISKYDGETTITVRGPETRASPAFMPADGEFIGINFKIGAFMPTLLPKSLKDRRDVSLPVMGKQSFTLDSSRWEIPNFENIDVFVAWMVRAELLVYDPLVGEILKGHPQPYSPRAIQYHFVRATGLSHKVIQQIERAEEAMTLLKQGTSIADTTYKLGYYDQSHLTNALKRFLGETPTQIAALSQPE